MHFDLQHVSLHQEVKKWQAVKLHNLLWLAQVHKEQVTPYIFNPTETCLIFLEHTMHMHRLDIILTDSGLDLCHEMLNNRSECEPVGSGERGMTGMVPAGWEECVGVEKWMPLMIKICAGLVWTLSLRREHGERILCRTVTKTKISF